MCATVPCDLTYWPNDLKITRGSVAQMQATALNAAFRSVRLMTTCCSTNLLVHHPAYKDNVVMAHRECLVDATLPRTGA